MEQNTQSPQSEDGRTKALEDIQSAQHELQAAKQDIQAAEKDIQSTKEDVEATKKEIQATSKAVQTTEHDVQTTEKALETTSKDIKKAEGAISTVERDIEVVEKDIKIVEKDIELVEEEVRPFTEFVKKFNNDWSTILASALAYHLLTSMFPIIFATLAIFGLFVGKAELEDKQHITAQITQFLQLLPTTQGANGSDIANIIVKQLPQLSGPLGIVAVIAAIFGGSRLFILIEEFFDLIYRVRPRTFLNQNVMAIGMFFLFLLLIPIMIVASSAPTFIFSALHNSSLGGVLESIIGILSSLLVSAILFQAIYMVVPNQTVSFRNSWRGTVVATIALEVFLLLFPLYVRYLLRSYIGGVGFVIILLAFFYYFALFLIIGAEVNAYFAEDIRATLSNLPTLVCIEGGRDVKQPQPEVSIGTPT